MPINSSEHDRYILHLNHALALEAALVDHLEKRAASVSNPVVRQRLLEHRDETVQHREAVRDCIQSLAGEATTTKAVVQSAIAPGLLGKVMTALESEKEDRALMEDLADFAVENYEDGLYAGISLIARNLGFPHHATRFEQIRKQERAMADFIAEHQPEAVREAFPPVAKAA